MNKLLKFVINLFFCIFKLKSWYIQKDKKMENKTNINKRVSVFETNSSSSHSIHISDEIALYDTTLIPNTEGIIELEGGEFGWEWARFNDAKTKANYAAVLESGANRELLIKAIKEQTGAKEVVFKTGEWSYIDHESVNLISEIDSVEKMKNWIFNPNTWLVTGNDNSKGPFNIYDFPTYDKEGALIPYEYKYEFKIKNITGTVKLSEDDAKSEEKILEAIESLIDYGVVFTKSKEGETEAVINSYNTNVITYGFNNWAISDYINLIDLENKYFIVYSRDLLENDVNKLIELYKQKNFTRNVIVEKWKNEENLNSWEIRMKFEKILKARDIKKYTMNINYELVEI